MEEYLTLYSGFGLAFRKLGLAQIFGPVPAAVIVVAILTLKLYKALTLRFFKLTGYRNPGPAVDGMSLRSLHQRPDENHQP